ncbi:hypothetical protein N7513_003578 [Penicillium frequentans]|nr:hypothetical protein N7513_003578 [Penicillium glabrum]
MATSEPTHFRKAASVDDEGLKREVKVLLGGKEVVLDNEKFDVSKRYVDAKTACAILIHENGPTGVVHTRDGASKVEILPTGPNSGNGFRIVVLSDTQTCLFYGQPSVRCFHIREN